jgi:hypothetical protein
MKHMPLLALLLFGLQGIPKNEPPFPSAILPDPESPSPIQWPAPPSPPIVSSIPSQELLMLSGTIVNFNSFLMPVTARADLIVNLGKGEQFVRLVYCPFDCAFDAPAANASHVPPRQMITDGNILWTFRVYSPRSFWERDSCAHIQKAAIEKSVHNYDFIDYPEAYKRVPNAAAPSPADLKKVPCMIIESWSKAENQPVKKPVSVPSAR